MYAFNGKNVKQIHKNVPEFLYKIQYKHINRGNLHVFTNIKTSIHTHTRTLWVNIVFQILATNYKNNVKDYDVLQRNRFVYYKFGILYFENVSKLYLFIVVVVVAIVLHGKFIIFYGIY